MKYHKGKKRFSFQILTLKIIVSPSNQSYYNVVEVFPLLSILKINAIFRLKFE